MAGYLSRLVAQRSRVIVALLALAALAANACAQLTELGALQGGKRWAFVVGASNYEHFSKLSYSASDARRFADLLIKEFGFEPDTVKLLHDEAEPRLTPTAGHILGELAALLEDPRLDKGDLFVFYFTGHGEGRSSGDYLLPLDARKQTVEQLSVPVKKVIEQFVNAGLRNVLIIADACRAGEENTFGQELQRLGDQANIAVMLGCAPGRKSYEFDELGQGAFSHFLFKALRDPSMRDPKSGALWASRVAERVARDVFDYTAPIKREKYAQRPASWTDQTRDVLLGAFIPASLDPEALDVFRKQAGSLNRQSFAAALGEYGGRLFVQDRYAECIEVFKTLDQLGEMSPETLYLLGVSLLMVDRSIESSRIFDRLIAMKDVGFYRDLALTAHLGGSVSAAQRMEAAQRLWADFPEPWVAMLGWTLVRVSGNDLQRAAWLEQVRPTLGQAPRLHAYLEGEHALDKGDTAGAIRLFRQAVKTPGDVPENDMLYNLMLVALSSSATAAEVDALIDEAVQAVDAKGDWLMRKARRRLMAGKRDEAMQLFAEAVAADVGAMDLVEAMKEFGIHTIPLAAKIAELAKKHPLSWRHQLAAALANADKNGGQDALQALLATENLVDDPVEFQFIAAAVLTQMISQLIELDAVSPTALQEMHREFCNDLTPLAGSFAPDLVNWRMYVVMMLGVGREDILGDIARRHLAPKEGPDGLPANLRLLALGAFANARMTEMVDATYRLSGFLPRNEGDAAAIFGAYHALFGELAKAEAALASPAPCEEFGAFREAARIYVGAKSGKRDEARKLAEAFASEDMAAAPMMALAWLALGDAERAKPWLNRAATFRASFTGFVDSALNRVLADRHRKEGRIADAEHLAYLSGSTRPGSPLERELHFGAMAERKQFAGTHEWKATAQMPRSEAVAGSLTLILGEDGKASGFFLPEGGAPQVLTGTFDDFGNLSAELKGAGDAVWKVSGKLPAAGTFERVPDMAETGLVLRLASPKGVTGYWFVQPKRAGRASIEVRPETKPLALQGAGGGALMAVTVMPATLPDSTSTPMFRPG